MQIYLLPSLFHLQNPGPAWGTGPDGSSSQAAATGGDPAAVAFLPAPPDFPQVAATGGDPAADVNFSPLSQAVATGGDPEAVVFSSPLPDVETLFSEVAALWPGFGELRAAASAPKRTRLRSAIGALLSEASVIFASELLDARCQCSLGLLLPPSRGAAPAFTRGPAFFSSTVIASCKQGGAGPTTSVVSSWPRWPPDHPEAVNPDSDLLRCVSVEPRLLQPLCTSVSCHFLLFLPRPRGWLPVEHGAAGLCFSAAGFFTRDGRVLACLLFRLPVGWLDDFLCFFVSPPDVAEQLSLFFWGPILMVVACSHPLACWEFTRNCQHII